MHTLRREITSVEVRVLDPGRKSVSDVCGRTHRLRDELETRGELDEDNE